MASSNQRLRYFGIRHHGPGSAASLIRALQEFAPDKILLEGPPEAESLLEHIGKAALKPPVAQLIYAPDDHRLSVFYPFAEFSPEWQTLQYAQQHQVDLSFFDLPQKHSLALKKQAEALSLETADVEKNTKVEPESDVTEQEGDSPSEADLENQDNAATELFDSLEFPCDPLDLLAQAAGHEDGESWWEQVVELTPQESDLFDAITLAMTEVRDVIEAEQPISQREQMREAWMRKMIREAQKQDHQRIAVICGAWHVPALKRKVTVKDDNAVLKGLPKIALKATWIPWTHGRISYRSGYGAGVHSPGWYQYLWQQWQQEGANIAIGWLTQAAHLLRNDGIDVPPASVIEAVRLANSLATLRQKSAPSLLELNEAIQTIYGHGEDTLLHYVQEKMVIGEALGTVPDSLPVTPLQEDFTKRCKTLRVKPQAVESELVLDLRKPSGIGRSELFHQLNLLGITWAKEYQSGGKGTFKEVWQLRWEPDFELELIEKSVWGNSVASAAGAFTLAKMADESLAQLVRGIHHLLQSNLPEAIANAVVLLNDKAAITHHVTELMQSLPELARVCRYGDVRNTDVSAIEQVVASLVERISIGLQNECRALDEDSARTMTLLVTQVDEAIQLLANPHYQQVWQQALLKFAETEELSGILIGRSVRLLMAQQVLDAEAAPLALSQALSQAEAPEQAALWIEGLLEDGGLMLQHDEQLWHILNSYILGLNEERFIEISPLLRRTFSSFSASECSALLGRASSSAVMQPVLDNETDFDHLQAAQIVPLICKILE
ncbi:hypothetical protein EZV61_17190 [Corallincola luteus]|uniref:Uncharacterized protein n=1 Tax=Corallincola luteus TaxID=1775177 RepID=A0ABY2AKJ6_9GAMM|nr:DUF5682 family protein [Corallincola luteus]TCI01705.1 hypothetical protein EZV61_17190 [Corallincola luteus]